MKIPFQENSAVGRTYINLAPEVTAAILRTVQAGWLLAKQRVEVTSGAREVAITECLRDSMRLALNQKQVPWRRTMLILPGTESRSQPGMTSPDGRTDIPLMLIEIFLRYGEHDPHAIIECKRLSANDIRLAREYVTEGIDRFCSGKYAANHSQGFMVGYVENGGPTEVIHQINAYIVSLGRLKEQLQPSSVIVGENNWLSKHLRAAGSTIDIHHAMLLLPLS